MWFHDQKPKKIRFLMKIYFRVGAIKTTKTPARVMLVSKIVRPQDRLKRGLKQAIKALLGAVAR